MKLNNNKVSLQMFSSLFVLGAFLSHLDCTNTTIVHRQLIFFSKLYVPHISVFYLYNVLLM